MTLRLHWSPDSANLVVRLALDELGLGFEAVRVNRSSKEHKSPAYLRLNPQGLLPVLEDGDLVLFETGAILLHLADRTGRLGPEGPAANDHLARTAFLKWLFYISNTIHAELRAAFYSHRYVDKAEAIPVLRAGLATRLRQHMALMDQVLAPTGWLVASTPTLADIYLVVCLRWAQLYPTGARLIGAGDIPPRLGALMAALESRPAVSRAFAAEFIAGRPLTAPEPPVLSAAEITG